MKLPSPRDHLAGCVWLPRIIAKARLLNAGKLPPDYVSRFGHVSGVDGQFLSFFSLTTEQILAVCDRSDEEIAAWFGALPAAGVARIQEWNHLGMNLGRPGFPMAERFPIAMATIYKHLQGQPIHTVFEALDADERND
jgi:hypothetical protein